MKQKFTQLNDQITQTGNQYGITYSTVQQIPYYALPSLSSYAIPQNPEEVYVCSPSNSSYNPNVNSPIQQETQLVYSPHSVVLPDQQHADYDSPPNSNINVAPQVHSVSTAPLIPVPQQESSYIPPAFPNVAQIPQPQTGYNAIPASMPQQQQYAYIPQVNPNIYVDPQYNYQIQPQYAFGNQPPVYPPGAYVNGQIVMQPGMPPNIYPQ